MQLSGERPWPSPPAILPRDSHLLALLVVLLGFFLFLLWPDLVPASFFEAPAPASVEPADAIVYLGGDPRYRVQKSLGLLQEGKGRFLLITGENGFTTNRLKALLPPEQRVVEPAATSTWENALYSYPLLRDRGAKSAILVTDWWHTRRALACFRRVCPDIQLSVVPSRPHGVESSISDRRREYVARIWYALRYAVW